MPFAVVTLALLASCGGGETVTGPGGNGGAVAAQVVLTVPATSVGVGSTVALDADVLNAAGSVLSTGVAWSSSNTSVATVSGGVVTGRAAGSTTIRAAAGEVFATVTFTVGAPVASLVLADPAPAGLPVGARVSLAALLRDAGGSELAGRLVTWTSANPAIARVESGRLIGVSSGSVNVIAASEGRSDTASVMVGAPPTITRTIATAQRSTCALTDVGAAWCWGPVFGERTSLNTDGRTWPREIGGGVFFTSVAVSFTHACGLTAAGEAWCWGANDFGQRGNGTKTTSPSDQYVATRVVTERRFTSIQVENGRTLARATDGTAWAWGRGGELGDNYASDQTTPVQVGGGLTFRLLSTQGYRGGGVGITPGNVMYAWEGGAPMEVPYQDSTFVARLTTLSSWGSMLTGLSSTGELWSWTWGPDGNYIGSGYTASRLQPAYTFQRFETDGYTAMGLTTTGTLVGWGMTNYGVLGNGSGGNTEQTVAVQVSGGRTYSDFAMRDGLAFGIDGSGRTYAWGGGNSENDLAIGARESETGYLTPQAPVTAAIVWDDFNTVPFFELDAGQTDSVTIIFRPAGGSFNRAGTGIAIPRGPQTLSLAGLPSGVTARVRRFVSDAGFGPFDVFTVILEASGSAATSDASVTIQASAPGATPGSVQLGLQVVGSTPPPALDLVCTSGTTPSNFPAGYQCVTNPAGASVPVKFSIPQAVGSWYDSSVGVCVTYGADGQAQARFQAGLGGSPVVDAGKWGALSRRDGTLEAAPSNGMYLYTDPFDDQMKILVFVPSSSAFFGYNFQRGACPW